MGIIGKNYEGACGHGRNDIERMQLGFVPVEKNSIPLRNSRDTSNDPMIPKIECWRSLCMEAKAVQAILSGSLFSLFRVPSRCFAWANLAGYRACSYGGLRIWWVLKVAAMTARQVFSRSHGVQFSPVPDGHLLLLLYFLGAC